MEGSQHPKHTPGACSMYSSGMENLQGKETTKGKGKDTGNDMGKNVM